LAYSALPRAAVLQFIAKGEAEGQGDLLHK
jgi:hypothetical protein